MIGAGINTRVGPICRTVEDAARVLTVIAGYDPKDPLTAFSIGRMPAQPYETFAHGERLDGVRIGVVREFMDKRLFTKTDEETIDIVDRRSSDLRRLGATIVDPGRRARCFSRASTSTRRRRSASCSPDRCRELFPVDAQGKPTTDHIATLVDMAMDPSRFPTPSRSAASARRRRRERAATCGSCTSGSAATRRSRPAREMTTKVRRDHRSAVSRRHAPGGGRAAAASGGDAMELNMAERMLQRFAFQQTMLQCMAELQLDAVVYPTMNIPPLKIQQPEEPTVNNRGGYTGPCSVSRGSRRSRCRPASRRRCTTAWPIRHRLTARGSSGRRRPSCPSASTSRRVRSTSRRFWDCVGVRGGHETPHAAARIRSACPAMPTGR